MEVEILTPLITQVVPRQTKAPWLKPEAIKVQLYKEFAVRLGDEVIVVPKGYVSDWSSLPRLLWWWWPPNYCEARHGALVHDYLYSHLYWYYTKDFADRAMRAMMYHDGAPALTCDVFYWGVHHGGRGGWYHREQPNSHPHWKMKHEKFSYSTGRTLSPAPTRPRRRVREIETLD